MFDLLVAGGGPVGLATSLYAHRAGLTVAVVEPRRGAIDKACGEGLMPGGVRALADLGVEPAGMPLRGIRYADGCRTVDAAFAGGMGLGVRRTTLHASLLAAVQGAGIPLVCRAVDSIDQRDGRVRAAGLTARYLAAADGLHSPIRRMLDLDAPTVGSAARYGLRRHFEVEPWTDFVEVHWARELEAYVTPVSQHLVGVALLTSRRASFDDQVGAFPRLRERLGAASTGSAKGAGPLRQRSSARVAGRVLFVGDAAGYVDALTGEGMATGFATARRLVDCLRAGRPADYERLWWQTTRRYRWITGSLLWSRSHGLGRAVVPAAHRLPWAFSSLVQQLAS